MEILCKCGCGLPAQFASRTDAAKGWIKGQQTLFAKGHAINRHSMSYSAEYSAWKGMFRRCYGKANNSHRYKERGIFVCERWNRFDNFIQDMGQKPNKSASLDRIDNDGPYSPENCRWADKITQDNNKSINVKISYNGENLSISQWSRKLNINCRTLHNRFTRGKETPPHLFRPVYRRTRSSD